MKSGCNLEKPTILGTKSLCTKAARLMQTIIGNAQLRSKETMGITTWLYSKVMYTSLQAEYISVCGVIQM